MGPEARGPEGPARGEGHDGLTQGLNTAQSLQCPWRQQPGAPPLNPPACGRRRVQLWNLNGATYEGYRAYIRYVKDHGWPESGAGPDPSPSRLATADSGLLDPSVSRLPTTESLPAEVCAATCGGTGQAAAGRGKLGDTAA